MATSGGYAAAAPTADDEPMIEELEEDEQNAAEAAPAAGDGPSERRARVIEPVAEDSDGPTYYRIGVDHEYEPGTEEIHFQCTRIKKLENLEAAGDSLKNLTLIANCIEKIENLEALVNLEHLELYQNLVKRIENIGHLSKLTTLDLSFNKIRNLQPLASCVFDQLDQLYLSNNKLDVIEGVFHFSKLTMLELGSNRFRVVPPEIGQLTELKELWLGKNKIGSMALPKLPKLQKLSMQSNRLEVWDAALFHNCPALSHLYLGHNNLPDPPEELAVITKLTEVDLAANAVKSIKPFPQLVELQELWLNDNKIEDLSEVRHLASFPALKAVYLERNPCHGLGDENCEKRYKDAILEAVPHLYQLDAERLNCKIRVITDGSERNVIGIRKR